MNIEIARQPIKSGMLPTREASRFLTMQGYPTAAATLSKWRCVGGGPSFRRYGRKIVYGAEDLMTWAENRLSRPMSNTSEQAVPEAKKEQSESIVGSDK